MTNENERINFSPADESCEDEIWFCELQGVEPSDALHPAASDDRENLRTHWDRIEQNMHAYLANLTDEMLFGKLIEDRKKIKI